MTPPHFLSQNPLLLDEKQIDMGYKELYANQWRYLQSNFKELRGKQGGDTESKLKELRTIMERFKRELQEKFTAVMANQMGFSALSSYTKPLQDSYEELHKFHQAVINSKTHQFTKRLSELTESLNREYQLLEAYQQTLWYKFISIFGGGKEARQEKSKIEAFIKKLDESHLAERAINLEEEANRETYDEHVMKHLSPEAEILDKEIAEVEKERPKM